mmetsp:Transcript_16754/g.39779  ORF Transcript_16754/g.39779 Transcript_16754/m.39779 type:complete len:118 (+) Transcript_16754:648-1001(+)
MGGLEDDDDDLFAGEDEENLTAPQRIAREEHRIKREERRAQRQAEAAAQGAAQLELEELFQVAKRPKVVISQCLSSSIQLITQALEKGSSYANLAQVRAEKLEAKFVGREFTFDRTF